MPRYNARFVYAMIVYSMALAFGLLAPFARSLLLLYAFASLSGLALPAAAWRAMRSRSRSRRNQLFRGEARAMWRLIGDEFISRPIWLSLVMAISMIMHGSIVAIWMLGTWLLSDALLREALPAALALSEHFVLMYHQVPTVPGVLDFVLGLFAGIQLIILVLAFNALIAGHHSSDEEPERWLRLTVQAQRSLPRQVTVRLDEFGAVYLCGGPVAYTELHKQGPALIIGSAFFLFLDKDELQALVIHERAHHRLLGLGLIWLSTRIEQSHQRISEFCLSPEILTMELRMYRGGGVFIGLLETAFKAVGLMVLGLTWPLRALLRLLVRYIGRQIEFACDRKAALAVGSAATIRMLQKVLILSIAWEFYVDRWYHSGSREDALRGFVDFVKSGVLEQIRPEVDACWSQSVELHPSGRERAAALGANDIEVDTNLAWDIECDETLLDELAKPVNALIAVSAPAAEERQLALAIADAHQHELARLGLSASPHLLPTLMFMRELLPEGEVLTSRTNLDPVCDSAVRCLSALASRGEIAGDEAQARIRQLHRGHGMFGWWAWIGNLRARRALLILTSLWRARSADTPLKARSFVARPRARLGALRRVRPPSHEPTPR